MEPSNTPKYINLSGVVTGLVVLFGPMYLCVCVNEKHGDGEGSGCDNEDHERGVKIETKSNP